MIKIKSTKRYVYLLVIYIGNRIFSQNTFAFAVIIGKWFENYKIIRKPFASGDSKISAVTIFIFSYIICYN